VRPARLGARVAVAVAACVVAVLASAAGVASPPAPAQPDDGARTAARGPVVTQLVAFRSGAAFQRRVRAALTRPRVGRRRCAVAPGTALATLIRSRPGRLGLRDFGSCSRRARDAGQLFVTSIRGERNRGVSGWVYKVGNRLATAGSGDPSGPFGRGRLRRGSRVTWFYCRMEVGSCQRTLHMRVTAGRGGAPTGVLVRGFDDRGDGVPVAGATVSGGRVEAQTNAQGRATLALPPGRRVLRARKPGLVPAFAEPVTVR
jgi:hypothetical protein